MSGTIVKADRLGDDLLARGHRVKEMLLDGVIDEDEKMDLMEMAFDLIGDGLRAYSIGVDAKAAKQVLTLGCEHTPNRHLQDLNEDLARMQADLEAEKRASRLGQSRKAQGTENQAA